MRMMLFSSFSAFWRAVVTASSRDSVRWKRSSLYLLASSWPSSPMRMIFLMLGVFKIS